ncbi:DNA primase [Kangiella sp. HZ709]|uniref:DNA primase n=1 Tax=Kangiella sp. HZ709 TaxID=2666328 RepID=UPI0012AF8228|nr:DNA primase [Kangiella sp. HZ709]MRX28667.1 DNA primase [Kangiella sp. HZ709]
MGLIPQHFIQDLLNRIDIIDLIDSRVPLKKAGANYKACCPFHGEKTPSFNVSQTKQFYHCFGCGINGNAISFLMEYDRLEFPDAVEELASSIGLEVPREEGNDNRPKIDNSLYDLMSKIASFYQQQLRSANGKAAVNYLKNRGLSGEIAKHFGLGFVPEAWDSLEKLFGSFAKNPKLKQQLIDCGMLIQKDGDSSRVYDRFRDRIMFPIKDKRGRVIAFGGRVMGDGEPKYLNSPETPIFHKSNELYGLHQARQANRNLARILIVEGYMDVVALAQFEITNAVATLGTATTATHIQQLFRTSRELVLCFDGDKAGRNAALKALEHGLPQLREGREIKLMFLPDGEDPDSMVRKVGKDKFEQLVERSHSTFDFLLKYLSSQVDLDSVAGRGQLVHLAKPYIEKITDPVYRELFTQSIAVASGLAIDKIESLLSNSTNNITGKQTATKPTYQANHNSGIPQDANKPNKASNKSVQLAITLLLQQPTLGLSINGYDWLLSLNSSGPKILHEILEIIHKNPNLSSGALLEYWREKPLYARMSQLAIAEREEKIRGNEAQELQDCIQTLLKEARNHRLSTLQNKSMEQGLSSSEKAEYQQLLLLSKQ